MTTRAGRLATGFLVLVFLTLPRLATETGAAESSWWNQLYVHRMKVTVSAGGSDVLAGYTASLTFDHASLVGAGSSLANGDDVRMAYWNGSAWIELDRILDSASSWNAVDTTILFRTQATIAGSTSDDNYYLYYSFASAAFPPADPSNVYLLSDGFESGDLEAWVDGSNGYGDSINVVNASVMAASTGTGADGPITISSPTGIGSVGGVATTVTLNPTGRLITVASTAGFSAGDEIMLVNVQGVPGDTGAVGKYEFLTIASVPSATVLRLQTPVRRSYDGASFANQKTIIQRVPQWTTVTIDAGGSLTASAWDGTSGGIVAFRATGAVTVNAGGSIDASALGYRGGTGGGGTAGGVNGESYDGYDGSGGDDSVSGAGGGAFGTAGGGASSNAGPTTTSPFDASPAGYRGGGGGGGNEDASTTVDGAGGGGGGGYGGGGGGGGGGGDNTLPGSGGSGGTTGVGAGGGGSGGDGPAEDGGAGGNAGSAGGGPVAVSVAGGYARTGQGGNGGSTNPFGLGAGGGGGGGQYGFADLATEICFGSGGGGGGDHDNGALPGHPGGAGGGIIYIAADSVTVNAAGAIRANGASGSSTTDRRGAGGGGAGGSIRIDAGLVSNTGTFTATGGSGGADSGLTASPGAGGGAGGVGRIRIEATLVAGTTTPAYFVGSGNPVHTGSYSAMSVTDGTDDPDPADDGAFADSVADFPPQTAVYIDGWFFLPTGTVLNDYLVLVQTVGLSPSWTNLPTVTLDPSGVLFVWNAAAGTGYFGTTVVTTNAWHRIEAEFVISDAAGEARVWLDGVLEIDQTGIDTEPASGAVTIERILLGNFWQGDHTDPNTVYNDDNRATALGPAPTTALSPEETTAVELLSFDARPQDSAITLSWRTASELDNLGFHLHRSLSTLGPWTRITPAMVPGLGSSPEGASYSFRDSGLANGSRYFYLLEDIDASSVSTFHGPASAVPGVGPPPDEDRGESDGPAGGAPGEASAASERVAHGDPEGTSWRVLSRGPRSLVLELWTPGFYATETAAGHRFFIPGFDEPSSPTDPAIPFLRAVVGARVGRAARVAWVRHEESRTYPGFHPAAVGEGEMIVGWDGTARPGRRPRPLRSPNVGMLPERPVRIAGDGFMGEEKKLALELSPLRFDAVNGEMRLSRRMRVKIVFDRVSARKEEGRGSRGRRRPRSVFRGTSRVLAYLHTAGKGLYGVSFEALFPEGHRPIPVDSLKLTLQGGVVPFHVQPRRWKTFGPGSALLFYAVEEAGSTDYSAEVSYALEEGSGGLRMKVRSAAPSRRLRQVAASPAGTADYETNRYYQAGLLEAPDIWLWDYMTGGTSRSYPLDVEGLDTASPNQAQLHAVFQGASDAAETEDDHHLRVSLNGRLVGEIGFGGKVAQVLTANVPSSVLVEGENELAVTNVGDTGAYSYVFLDRVRLVYPEVASLRGGVFEGVFGGGGMATVKGDASYALDVTNPRDPRWLVRLKRGRGRVRLRVGAERSYLLTTRDALRVPRVEKALRSTLRRRGNQADYVLIAPREYLEAAEPLLQRRRDQGLAALGVSFEEITSEFGHGRPSAQAIRSFLAYAYHSWEEPSLRYVLLLGDSSYDPRNMTGLDQGAPLPVEWVKTSYMWTASDPTLAAINGEDLLPDVSIGRLPAKTLEEAEALVQKVLAWEGRDLRGTAVLVADNPDDGGDFEAGALDIRESFLTDRPTKTLFLRELGAGMRGAILSSFDAGASLMSYVGHGGAAVWASENVLNSWDPPKLLAQSHQPLMLTFNCLNGYFVAPSFDALSEAFLKVEGRGTIGAFTPSGLSLDAPAHRFHRALMAEITGGEHERLGDAVMAAQAAYAEEGVMPELLSIYHLLADPGMRIRR